MKLCKHFISTMLLGALCSLPLVSLADDVARPFSVKIGLGKAELNHSLDAAALTAKGYTVNSYQVVAPYAKLGFGVKLTRGLTLTAQAERYFVDNAVERYELGLNYSFSSAQP